MTRDTQRWMLVIITNKESCFTAHLRHISFLSWGAVAGLVISFLSSNLSPFHAHQNFSVYLLRPTQAPSGRKSIRLPSKDSSSLTISRHRLTVTSSSLNAASRSRHTSLDNRHLPFLRRQHLAQDAFETTLYELQLLCASDLDSDKWSRRAELPAYQIQTTLSMHFRSGLRQKCILHR